MVADTDTRGAVVKLDIEFKAALAANRTQGRTCGGTCRHDFGDAGCGLSMGPLEVYAMIAATDGRTWVEVEGLAPPALGQWLGGLVRLAGVDYEISRQEDERLTVYGPMAGAVPGAPVLLTPGCSKLWDMCKAFGNAAQFGGFPHVPGRDAAYRIAKQGDGRSHTGGSLFSDGVLIEEEDGDGA